jgi:hypothetical protein
VPISKQMRTYTNKAEGRSAERFFGRGEGILLALKMTTILVLAALILAAPAVAQESPADAGEANAGSQQYRVHSSEALADGIRDASDTAGRGADAVNDALDDAPEDAGPATELPVPRTARCTGLPCSPRLAVLRSWRRASSLWVRACFSGGSWGRRSYGRSIPRFIAAATAEARSVAPSFS